MPGIFGFDRIEIIDEPLDAGQRLPVIAVPRIALDTLQLARDVFGFSWVLMRQSLGVLPDKRRVFDGDAIRARIPPPFPVA